MIFMISLNLLNSENYNSCGFIFEKQLFLSREYGLTKTRIDDIKSIKLVNGRNMEINFLLITISILAFYFSLFYFDIRLIYEIISLIIIIPLFITAFFFKKNCSKIIIITKNLELITSNVDSKSKEEAKEIVLKVNNELEISLYSLVAS